MDTIINEIKETLYKTIEICGVCSELTLKISQFLDLLIVNEMQTSYKIHEKDEEYILDILKEEEEKLTIKLGIDLNDYDRYLFFRYICVRDTIDKLKYKIA